MLDVTAFRADAIEGAPDIGVSWPSDYIGGVARRSEGFVVLIDVARIFSSADAAFLKLPAAA